MKKFLIMFFVLFPAICFADVTAEVLSTTLDARGNIEVHTQYKVDGVEVVSPYPKEDGKSYYVTRYSVQNFSGMTDAEKLARINQDLQAYGEQLIRKPYQNEAVQLVKDANADLIKTDFFKTLAGKKVTITEAKMQLDTDFNGKPDKEWTMTTTNKTEKQIEEDIITPL